MASPTVEQVAEIARRTGVSADAVLRVYTSPDRTRVATHVLVGREAPAVGAPPPPPRRPHQ